MSDNFPPQPPQGPGGPQDGQPQWPYGSPAPGPYGMPGGGPPTHPSPGPYGAPQPSYAPRPPMPPRKGSNTGLIIGLIAGGAAALLILVIGIVVLVGGSESDDLTGLATPPVKSDPVPTGPLVKTTPPDCGVSSSTRSAVAPGAENSGSTYSGRSNCRWRSGSLARSDGGSKRTLDVTVEREEGSSSQSPISEALGTFTRDIDSARRTSSGTEIAVKDLSGLGNEAVTWHVLDTFDRAQSTVLFRAGNAVIKIEYGGADYAKKGSHKETLVSEDSARNGAVKVAQDIAKSLGLPANTTPKVTPPQAVAPPIQQLPKACDSIPASIVKKLTKDANGRTGYGRLFSGTEGIRSDTCRWSTYSGGTRSLEVIMATAPDVTPGSGTRTAAREYTKMHIDARDKETSSVSEQKSFNALTRLGDEAYGSYYQKSSSVTSGMTGEVVFRVRNALVQVTFSGSDDNKSLPKDKALNGAYTAAAEVAKQISS